MFNIVIKNFSQVLSDQEIQDSISPFQRALDRDFTAAWAIKVGITFEPSTARLKTWQWLLGVFDDADQAGALGYHDVTSHGTPLGKVFAKTTMNDGGRWDVTFTHELFEMALDPWIVLGAEDASTERIWAYEACDAVEADNLAYKIGTTHISDFVLPGYFESSISQHQPLSFCGNVNKPFSLAPGGYMSYIDMNHYSQGWQQINAKKGKGTRAERRQKPRNNRQRSTGI